MGYGDKYKIRKTYYKYGKKVLVVDNLTTGEYGMHITPQQLAYFKRR